MKITEQKILDVVNECDFLGKDVVKMWQKQVKSVPESLYGMIYESFLKMKGRVNDFYVGIELARDKKGEYKKQIEEKYSEAVKMTNQGELNKLSSLKNV